MHINVPEFETSFVIPFKSGNRVIYSTLIEVFKLNNIEYHLVSDQDNLENTCNLFVRHPLDRFFSTYSWYLKLLRVDNSIGSHLLDREDLNKVIEYFKISKIDTLSDYISKYKTFLNICEDFHYLPQSSFFLSRKKDVGVRANINFNFRKEYDLKYEKVKHVFFRIEEINEIIKINYGLLETYSFAFPFKDDQTLENQKIKLFPFLNKFPEKLNHQFMAYYIFYMDFYNKNHHEKNYDIFTQITEDELNTAFDMFKKEMYFFGYDDGSFEKPNNLKKLLL